MTSSTGATLVSGLATLNHLVDVSTAGVTINQTLIFNNGTWVPGPIVPTNTDDITEGTTNLFFTNSRVLATPLTGLSTGTNSSVSSSDTVLSGIGKLQAQVSSLTGSSAVLSAGTIMAWAASAAPTGWALCDGSAVSRTTYANLFASIGTTYGVGDGSTTFNLPDFRTRIPRSIGSGFALGDKGGLDNISLTIANLPSHSHTLTNGTISATTTFQVASTGTNLLTSPDSTHNYIGGGGGGQAAAAIWSDSLTGSPVNINGISVSMSGSTNTTGSGNSFPVTNPYIAINWIIALDNVNAVAGGGGSSSLSGLSDVSLTSPTSTQYLKYNGSAWVNSTIAYSDITGTPTTISVIDDLSDVTITSPTANQYLKYNGSAWVNSSVAYTDVTGTPTLATVATSGSYTDLTNQPAIPGNSSFTFVGLNDTDDTVVANGFLRWNSGGTSVSYQTTIDYAQLTGLSAVAKSGQGALSYLTDASISSPATAQVLRYNGSAWVNATLGYGDLSGTPGVATTSSNGLLSSTDKTKLDGIATGATATPLSNSTPASLGTAASGSSTSAARADHVHPLQTTPIYAPVITETNTARTLALSDSGSYISTTNASAITVTIPNDSTVTWANYTEIHFEQSAAGKITFAAGSGVTLRSAAATLTTIGQYSVATLKRVAANTWTLFGSVS